MSRAYKICCRRMKKLKIILLEIETLVSIRLFFGSIVSPRQAIMAPHNFLCLLILFHHPFTQARQVSDSLSSPINLHLSMPYVFNIFQTFYLHYMAKEIKQYFPDSQYNVLSVTFF